MAKRAWIGSGSAIFTRTFSSGWRVTDMPPHTVGGKAFVEKVLSAESVEEHFEHFPILELVEEVFEPSDD